MAVAEIFFVTECGPSFLCFDLLGPRAPRKMPTICGLLLATATSVSENLSLAFLMKLKSGLCQRS